MKYDVKEKIKKMRINIQCESYEDPNNMPINLAAAIIQDTNLSTDDLEEVAEHLLAYVENKRRENYWA